MSNLDGNIMTAGGDNNINTSYSTGSIFGNVFNIIISAKDAVSDMGSWIGSNVIGPMAAALNPFGSDQSQKDAPSPPDPAPTKPSLPPPTSAPSTSLSPPPAPPATSAPSKSNRFSGLSSSHLRRELFAAVKRNNVEDVRELLRRGVDVNSLDVDRNTPLRVAVEGGSADIVDLLLAQEGVTVNDKNKSGQTFLIYAATWGLSDVIKSLLKHHSVDVNVRDPDGLTALGIAAYYGHADVVRLLVDDPRVEINAEAKNGYTPLRAAVESGNEEVVELLKGKKAICKPLTTFQV